MNKIVYEGTLSLELGKTIAPIRELEESLNTGLAKFGMEGQRVGIYTNVPFTLQVSRQLTEQEEATVKTITEQNSAKFNGKVTMFRRKSGNVSQEVS